MVFHHPRRSLEGVTKKRYIFSEGYVAVLSRHGRRVGCLSFVKKDDLALNDRSLHISRKQLVAYAHVDVCSGLCYIEHKKAQIEDLTIPVVTVEVPIRSVSYSRCGLVHINQEGGEKRNML